MLWEYIQARNITSVIYVKKVLLDAPIWYTSQNKTYWEFIDLVKCNLSMFKWQPMEIKWQRWNVEGFPLFFQQLVPHYFECLLVLLLMTAGPDTAESSCKGTVKKKKVMSKGFGRFLFYFLHFTIFDLTEIECIKRGFANIIIILSSKRKTDGRQ